jgi:extracellular factor (EF) 3-hydroxypalmitic acid methyl ester biosynthesis protein
MKTLENTGDAPVVLPAFAALFAEAEALIHRGESVEAIRRLGQPLSKLIHPMRDDPDAFPQLIRSARDHNVFSLVQQDPYTQRAFNKPRGYAGDAVMLDYVYTGAPPSETSAVGRSVFAATTRGPMGLSVVYRKGLLGSYIDDVVARNPDARILSVASGHCRELEGSLVESSMFKGEFIALDQDPQSCDEVRWRQHAMRANSRVRVVESSVRALLAGRHTDLGPFDLVYSAGLYDYLEPAVAQKLTTRLGALCAPEGRLLIANFVPDGYGRAYMELFMDWHLIVRDDVEMAELAGHAGKGTVRVFRDPHDNVVYAQWRRGGPESA